MQTSIAVAFIFLLAGFTQGVTGFGSALVAMPLLTLFLDVKTAVSLSALHGLVITLFLSFQMRKNLDRHKIIPLIAGSLPGVAMGIYFLKRADDSVIKMLLGIMLISYAVYRLTSRQVTEKISKQWGYLAGFATGAIGAAFSAGGPPAIIYTTLTGWDKDVIKATLSGFFLFVGFLVVLGHAATGVTTLQVMRLFGVSILFVLLGVSVGSIYYRTLKSDGYLRIVLVLLAVMGAMMAITAF